MIGGGFFVVQGGGVGGGATTPAFDSILTNFLYIFCNLPHNFPGSFQDQDFGY